MTKRGNRTMELGVGNTTPVLDETKNPKLERKGGK